MNDLAPWYESENESEDEKESLITESEYKYKDIKENSSTGFEINELDNELEDEKELLDKEYEDKNDMKEDNSLEVESKLLNIELEDKKDNLKNRVSRRNRGKKIRKESRFNFKYWEEMEKKGVNLEEKLEEMRYNRRYRY